MVDRIVISLVIGFVGGFVVWGAAALVFIINDIVPTYYLVVAIAVVSVAAFILDWRTRTNDQ